MCMNIITIIYIFIAIGIILYIFLKVNYPKLRGFYGEKYVKEELKKLSSDKYIILNDILIKDSNGTHQIDHIVITENEIFVIEMKNYYGLIVGNQYYERWFQYLGKYKNKFYNPLRQNYGHIKTLSKLLDLEEKYFVSIICFSNQSKLNVNTNEIVINLRDLFDTIYKYESNKLNILDKDKCKTIIETSNIVDKKIRKEHIKNIKTKK